MSHEDVHVSIVHRDRRRVATKHTNVGWVSRLCVDARTRAPSCRDLVPAGDIKRSISHHVRVSSLVIVAVHVGPEGRIATVPTVEQVKVLVG